MLVSFVTLSYYAPIVATSIFYLLVSLTSWNSELPWAKCNPDLAKASACVSSSQYRNITNKMQHVEPRIVLSAEQYFL